jgi:hypothetical protein
MTELVLRYLSKFLIVTFEISEELSAASPLSAEETFRKLQDNQKYTVLLPHLRIMKKNTDIRLLKPIFCIHTDM